MAFFQKLLNVHLHRTQLYSAERILRRFIGKKSFDFNEIISNNTEMLNKLSTSTDISREEWMNIRESISATLEDTRVQSEVYDSVIIDMCKTVNLDNAMSYFKFLESNNYHINIAIIAKYLGFFRYKINSITEAEKAHIIRIYDDLKTNYKYLDTTMCKNCIIALSLTDRWKEAYELWKTYKETHALGSVSFSCLAYAAIAHREENIAWEVLKESVLKGYKVQSFVYIKYIKMCEQDKEAFNVKVEKMFEFLRETSCTLPETVVGEYVDSCNKFGWSAAYTKIKSGQCKHCSESLLNVTFSEEDFKTLSTMVIEKMIISSDIYFKTSPKELSRFKKFVDRAKPFDIVIDGLNVSYVKGSFKNGTLGMLPKVVKHFLDQDKVILVLGRKHMNKNPAMKHLTDDAFVFLVQDLSKDDPFLLYATLASGNNAKFVSLDLMRQNKNLIEDNNLRKLFHQWQMSHQYLFSVNDKDQTFQLQEPQKYDFNVQKTGKCWHVPYKSLDSPNKDPLEVYEMPVLWACFKKPE